MNANVFKSQAMLFLIFVLVIGCKSNDIITITDLNDDMAYLIKGAFPPIYEYLDVKIDGYSNLDFAIGLYSRSNKKTYYFRGNYAFKKGEIDTTISFENYSQECLVVYKPINKFNSKSHPDNYIKFDFIHN